MSHVKQSDDPAIGDGGPIDSTDWQHQWHEWDEHNYCVLCGVDGDGFGDTFEIPPCSDNARRIYAEHKREVSGIDSRKGPHT